MNDSNKVLVVGTTADYIDWIRRTCPGRALFLTDSSIRHQAREPKPAPAEEILCDLSNYGQARDNLKRHLRKECLSLDGITSYDCESLELTAILAQDFDLSYPSVEAVSKCRDKGLSKFFWRQNGVNCPSARPVKSVTEAVSFLNEIRGPCVLKPVSGSGSELIFLCNSEHECKMGFRRITKGLFERRSSRMYKDYDADNPLILAEEFVNGEEFSCDFLIENGRAEVIRLSRKILSKGGVFGTVQGYVLPVPLPTQIDPRGFQQILQQSAGGLGITRAICMLDFLIRGNEIVLLELTPRPGGDCLPFLLKRRLGLDILKLNLDFAQKRALRFPEFDNGYPHIGLRLHADREGTLKRVDVRQLRQDRRVVEIHLTRSTGHVIRMPPADYDSWVLGHVIIMPFEETDLETQCDELLSLISVEVE